MGYQSFYGRYVKRVLDFVVALVAIIILSPLLLVLTLAGGISMKGNPFFTQDRPGKDEKIFKLIKFRSMTNEKDAKGNLLPNEDRLTKYGLFIRKTSLDELPELFNILIGDMSIVGPRPLLVKYLPLYNAWQAQRHKVRPGLTGLAQVSGRNKVTWQDRFEIDVSYVEDLNFWLDVQIILKTFITVFKREGISSDQSVTMEEFKGNDSNV